MVWNGKVIGISQKIEFVTKFDDIDEKTYHLNALKSLMAIDHPKF